MLLGGILVLGRSPPLSPGHHRPASHNLFGSIVRASAKKESKRHGFLLSVWIQCQTKTSENAWNCTVIIAYHCPTLTLEDSGASLQARRQIICNKSLSCDIGGLKSIFTSLWCAWLEDLCALPKPTKRKGYAGARARIASLPIGFLPILNSAPRRMKLAWVWIWYTTSVASSAGCRATSLKAWLMKKSPSVCPVIQVRVSIYKYLIFITTS